MVQSISPHRIGIRLQRMTGLIKFIEVGIQPLDLLGLQQTTVGRGAVLTLD
jgi:hypothetical protein